MGLAALQLNALENFGLRYVDIPGTAGAASEHCAVCRWKDVLVRGRSKRTGQGLRHCDSVLNEFPPGALRL